MTPEEYAQVSAQIGMIAGTVENMPLDEFIKEIERAETIGPVKDPILWEKEHDRIENVKKLAQKLNVFKAIVCEYFHDS